MDDEKDLVALIARRLEAAGYEVSTAYDGYEAVGAAQKGKPDLILLDLMLPKLNGHQVCRLLKFSDSTKEIPIVIFSARCQPEDRQTALECGADEYLNKPFDARYFTTLQSILNKN